MGSTSGQTRPGILCGKRSHPLKTAFKKRLFLFGTAFKKRDYPYAAILAEYPGAADRDEIGNTIYYNGAPTLRQKCRYVLDQRLAGVMIWSLDSDAAGAGSLLNVVHQALQPKP